MTGQRGQVHQHEGIFLRGKIRWENVGGFLSVFFCSSTWAVVKSHTVYFMRSTFKCHTVSFTQLSKVIPFYSAVNSTFKCHTIFFQSSFISHTKKNTLNKPNQTFLSSLVPNPAGGNRGVWMYTGFVYVFQSSVKFIEVGLGQVSESREAGERYLT